MKSTKEITMEYRLGEWAEVMRRRVESGMSIRAYCRKEGMHPNRYHYWQRKLRASVAELLPAKAETVVPSTPSGWTQVKIAEEAKQTNGGEVVIEIGKCRVLVKDSINAETLTQICKVLVSLC